MMSLIKNLVCVFVFVAVLEITFVSSFTSYSVSFFNPYIWHVILPVPVDATTLTG